MIVELCNSTEQHFWIQFTKYRIEFFMEKNWLYRGIRRIWGGVMVKKKKNTKNMKFGIELFLIVLAVLFINFISLERIGKKVVELKLKWYVFFSLEMRLSPNFQKCQCSFVIIFPSLYINSTKDISIKHSVFHV